MKVMDSKEPAGYLYFAGPDLLIWGKTWEERRR